MKKTVVMVFLSIIGCCACAQKKMIANDTWKSWERLDKYNISVDGKWVYYIVGKGEQYSPEASLYISPASGPARKLTARLSGAVKFSQDSRWIICGLSGDSILVEELSTGKQFFLTRSRPGVIVKLRGKTSLLYTDISEPGQLLAFDLADRRASGLGTSDGDLVLSPKGDVLAFSDSSSVKWMDLSSGTMQTIAKGSGKNLTFDRSGTRLAFCQEGPQGTAIRVYRKGQSEAVVCVAPKAKGLSQTGGVSGDDLRFSEVGDYLYFKVRQAVRMPAEIQEDAASPEILSFGQRYWKTSVSPGPYEQFTAVVSLISGNEVVVLDDNESAVRAEGNQIRGGVALMQSRTNTKEAYYRSSEIPRFHLFFLQNRTRTPLGFLDELPAGLGCWETVSLSPMGKYLIWSDGKDWFSYEVARGAIRNLTAALKGPVAPSTGMRLGSSCVWLEADRSLLLMDAFDVYQADPSGQKPTICLTGSYGQKQKLKFKLPDVEGGFGASCPRFNDGSLILKVQNDDTKTDGFATVTPGSQSGLRILSQDAYAYSIWGRGIGELSNSVLLKARNAEVFLLQRQSAAEAPNVCISTDLRSFHKLSDLAPQLGYNWMTSELVDYPMADGEQGKAILYKPEDFDPAKKYPVIFYYYQQNSNSLHEFLNPNLTRGQLSVPWYVSNGYLVCVPDILNDQPGKIAERTVNAVVSAVLALNKNPWFDSNRMGLQGHSMGGYETNLLIANTCIFAAANASAGRSDQIMGYDVGTYGHSFVERGQPNLGTTPWENLQVYIRNSPVLQADRITTPLLLMNNRGDTNVDFMHGYEMFAALRRLSKPVWLVSYPNEGHTIQQLENRLDFQVRQQEFFDHYLRGKPAPSWMQYAPIGQR